MQVKDRTLLEVCGGIALVLVLFLLVIGQTANATYNNDDDEANATATAEAAAQAQAQAAAEATGGEGGAANAEATGGANSLTFNGAARPDDIKIRNTASANMPNLTATAPCVVSGSLGVGVAGVNVGGGKTKIDPECNIRETARTFAGLGEIGLALTIACTSEVAQAALGDACGLSASNVYVRVNETVRYVERTTGGDTVHDVSDEAVDTCTESTTRAFEKCAKK